ncbi:MAG: cation transporter [Alphaproteobacteria bacterium]|nr:MAG: cation transporter [Alphaproteobacteria bacterium]
MTSGHSHTPPPGQAGAGHERSLWIALILTTSFMIAEVIGGILTGSLALISDAAHMFTDAAALAISLSAIQISKRAADAKRTFGYHRFEILAAAFNALLLFGVAIYILYEVWQRFNTPQTVQSIPMLVIASLGLVVNLISMRLLMGGKEGSLNIKGAYLEVWSDMLGSLGVIVGAVVIWLTGWTWVDSIIAVAIGLWVLPRTWSLLRDSMNILLEGVPDGVDIALVEKSLLSLPGVDSIHDLHVWAITTGKPSLSVHMVSTTGDFDRLAIDAAEVLESEFNIHHSTVQMERNPCEQAAGAHKFS